MADGSYPVREGFDALYRRHGPFVRAMLARHVPAPEVEDVAQEVFIVLLRKLEGRLAPASVRAWLYQAVRRVAANHRRGARRHERKRRALPPPTAPPDAEEMVRRRQAARLLDQFLDTLDDDARQIFVWSEVEGLRGREIAERLNLNLHTTYARIRVMRRRFAELVARRRRRGPWVWLLAPWLALRALATRAGGAARWGTLASTAAVVLASQPPASTTARAAVPAAADPPPASSRVAVVPWGLEPVDGPAPGPELMEFSAARVRGTAPTDVKTLALRPPGPHRLAHVAEVPPARLQPSRRLSSPAARAPAPDYQGVARDQDGRPMAFAELRCRRVTTSGLRRRCDITAPFRADAQGRFEARDLPPGAYELVPFLPGARFAADEMHSFVVE